MQGDHALRGKGDKRPDSDHGQHRQEVDDEGTVGDFNDLAIDRDSDAIGTFRIGSVRDEAFEHDHLVALGATHDLAMQFPRTQPILRQADFEAGAGGRSQGEAGLVAADLPVEVRSWFLKPRIRQWVDP